MNKVNQVFRYYSDINIPCGFNHGSILLAMSGNMSIYLMNRYANLNYDYRGKITPAMKN